MIHFLLTLCQPERDGANIAWGISNGKMFQSYLEQKDLIQKVYKKIDIYTFSSLKLNVKTLPYKFNYMDIRQC